MDPARTDVLVVYAQTQPGGAAADIAAFVVDAGRAGFRRDPRTSVGAVRPMGTSGFRLESYLCRDDEMLHPPGQAFKRALHATNGARVYVAAMCCSMVAESLRLTNKFGRQRRTIGWSLH